jgi:nucleoside 2-deoxyribosyltransferase
MTKLCYLAGPITGTTYDGSTSWRDSAIVELAKAGIIGISPMRGKDYLLDRTSISDAYDEYVLSTQKGIVTRDRWDCQRSDVVLVNVLGATKVSIGTVIELGWADAARRPIILVMDEGNPHDHAMVRELAGFIVPTLEQGLALVSILLG